MVLSILPALNLDSYKPTVEEVELLESFEQVIAHEIIEKNALLYIAGYVAHRFRNEYDNLGVPTKMLPDVPNDWLSFLSRGNCMYPSAPFQRAAEIMNEEFEIFHGNFFSTEDKIFDKLTEIVNARINNNFPTKVIACLVRTRTYIRVRKINREIIANNYIKKKEKKIYKLGNKQYTSKQ